MRVLVWDPLGFLSNKLEVVGDCWLWTLSKRRGYGRVKVAGQTYQAHRFVYELLVGPIPAGKELDHLCRIRHCVNPDHLEPVTRRENHMRGQGRWTHRNNRRTHCKWGHSLADAYPTSGGRRNCRTCHQDYYRRKALVV